MAGRKPSKLRPSISVQTPGVDDPTTQRALDTITAAVQEVQAKRSRDVVEDVDLDVGTNRIPHGLGRPCAGYTLTATVADATFAHAIDKDNPNPEFEVWITVVGVAQPGATVEVF